VWPKWREAQEQLRKEAEKIKRRATEEAEREARRHAKLKAEEGRNRRKEKLEERCGWSAAAEAAARQREAEEKEMEARYLDQQQKKEEETRRKKEEEAGKPVMFQARVSIRRKDRISSRDEYIQGIPGNATREEVERILSEKYAIRLRWTKCTRSGCRDAGSLGETCPPSSRFRGGISI
jgi:hypothetical protein